MHKYIEAELMAVVAEVAFIADKLVKSLEEIPEIVK